jgi:hypothetical protein
MSKAPTPKKLDSCGGTLGLGHPWESAVNEWARWASSLSAYGTSGRTISCGLTNIYPLVCGLRSADGLGEVHRRTIARAGVQPLRVFRYKLSRLRGWNMSSRVARSKSVRQGTNLGVLAND